MIEGFDATSYCSPAFHLLQSFEDKSLKVSKPLLKWDVTRRPPGKSLCRFSIEVEGQTTFGLKVCSTSVCWQPESNLGPEYDNLEAHIAAELVIRARSTQTAPQPPAGQYATAAPPYAAPQYGQVPQTPVQQQPPQAAAPPPNLANLITSLDGPALQKLLGAMAQNPQTPQQQTSQQAPHQHQQPLAPTAGTPDLAALLGGIPRQQAPSHQAYQQAQQALQQHNPYSALSSGPGFTGNPGLAALLGGGGNRAPSGALPPQQQGPQANQQHVQSIMEQLAKWKQ